MLSKIIKNVVSNYQGIPGHRRHFYSNSALVSFTYILSKGIMGNTVSYELVSNLELFGISAVVGASSYSVCMLVDFLQSRNEPFATPMHSRCPSCGLIYCSCRS